MLLIDLSAIGADPEVSAAVKARQGAVTARLARVWTSIRHGPAPLSHRQAMALAGDVYRP